MGSVALHELYFSNLGGNGPVTPAMATALTEHFGSVDAWRKEFMASARSLRGGSGWVLLTYSRRDRRLYNQIALDHSGVLVDATPVLVLDMYEHAYHIDFGANAFAYIDAFMRNIDWKVVGARLAEAVGAGTPSLEAESAAARSTGSTCRPSRSRSFRRRSPSAITRRCWTFVPHITSRATTT